MHRSPRTCHISYVAMAVSISVSDSGEMHSDFGDTARSFLSSHQSKCHECHECRLSASAATATLCRTEYMRCHYRSLGAVAIADTSIECIRRPYSWHGRIFEVLSVDTNYISEPLIWFTVDLSPQLFFLWKLADGGQSEILAFKRFQKFKVHEWERFQTNRSTGDTKKSRNATNTICRNDVETDKHVKQHDVKSRFSCRFERAGRKAGTSHSKVQTDTHHLYIKSVVVDVGLFGAVSLCSPRSFDDLISCCLVENMLKKCTKCTEVQGRATFPTLPWPFQFQCQIQVKCTPTLETQPEASSQVIKASAMSVMSVA